MGIVDKIRKKHLETWVPGYLRWLAGRVRSKSVTGPRHLLFALCDHYEPLWGAADAATGTARVRAWEDGYPRLASRFVDADGLHPRHSFFFPGEQYAPDYLSRLATLARAGFGEVEVHLHHDGDTAPSLRRDMLRYLELFGSHGHLSRDAGGRLRYAFIHGNWCLANARGDGRWCGVDEEIPLLWETGCYADFTFPSAPDECQPNIVNRIYWPSGDLARRRGYEEGETARVGRFRDDRLLMIEGPLAPALDGFRPRIESSALTAHDPATAARVRTWVNQGIHVEGRPEWVFVKVHTHGAPETQAASLLGAGGEALHRALAEYNDGQNWVLHYVTAREMYNIAVAAMVGRQGDPHAFRDFAMAPPPVVSS